MQYHIINAFLCYFYYIYTKAHSERLSAVVYNLKMGAKVTVTPKGTGVFNDEQAQSAEVVTVSKIEGQSLMNH